MTNDNTQLLLPISGTLPGHPAIDCVTESVPAGDGGSLPDCGRLAPAPSSILQYVHAATADNTRRAYRQDLQDFARWGGAVPCSPETLAAYIADRACTLSPVTLARRAVGIGRAHVSQGLPDPAKNDLVRTVLRGIRRTHGVAQRRVAPLLTQDIQAMVSCMSELKGTRDRALVLLGFAAALRRSEVAGLTFQDLDFVREGLIVHLRRSKTDQEGEGRTIAVPWGRTRCCPVQAVQAWLTAAGIHEGPVFRPINRAGRVRPSALSAQSVALVLKAYAERIGLDAADISGHSLRAGLVTSAIQAGVPAHKIQQQTGHRSAQMLARYIRDASIFDGNASGALL